MILSVFTAYAQVNDDEYKDDLIEGGDDALFYSELNSVEGMNVQLSEDGVELYSPDNGHEANLTLMKDFHGRIAAFKLANEGRAIIRSSATQDSGVEYAIEGANIWGELVSGKLARIKFDAGRVILKKYGVVSYVFESKAEHEIATSTNHLRRDAYGYLVLNEAGVSELSSRDARINGYVIRANKIFLPYYEIETQDSQTRIRFEFDESISNAELGSTYVSGAKNTKNLNQIKKIKGMNISEEFSIKYRTDALRGKEGSLVVVQDLGAYVNATDEGTNKTFIVNRLTDRIYAYQNSTRGNVVFYDFITDEGAEKLVVKPSDEVGGRSGEILETVKSVHNDVRNPERLTLMSSYYNTKQAIKSLREDIGGIEYKLDALPEEIKEAESLETLNKRKRSYEQRLDRYKNTNETVFFSPTDLSLLWVDGTEYVKEGSSPYLYVSDNKKYFLYNPLDGDAKKLDKNGASAERGRHETEIKIDSYDEDSVLSKQELENELSNNKKRLRSAETQLEYKYADLENYFEAWAKLQVMEIYASENDYNNLRLAERAIRNSGLSKGDKEKAVYKVGRTHIKSREFWNLAWAGTYIQRLSERTDPLGIKEYKETVLILINTTLNGRPGRLNKCLEEFSLMLPENEEDIDKPGYFGHDRAFLADYAVRVVCKSE